MLNTKSLETPYRPWSTKRIGFIVSERKTIKKSFNQGHTHDSVLFVEVDPHYYKLQPALRSFFFLHKHKS